MIIVKLKGGMGNQMFQYALGRHLSIKNQTPLLLDIHSLLSRKYIKDFVYRDYDLNIFKITQSFAAVEQINRIKKKYRFGIRHRSFLKKSGANSDIIHEPSVERYKEYLLNSADNKYIDGYWQSEKYFTDIAEIIKTDFTIRMKHSEACNELAKEITDNPDAVCVNLRRGDFLRSDLFNVCDINYYQDAVNYLSEHTGIHLYIFSDDIDWCIENLKYDYPTTFISNDYAGHKFSSYFYLMQQCKHFIIPNSSFAWWAAWLSKNPDKIVVAPKKWFGEAEMLEKSKDIVPDTWIRI